MWLGALCLFGMEGAAFQQSITRLPDLHPIPCNKAPGYSPGNALVREIQRDIP